MKEKTRDWYLFAQRDLDVCKLLIKNDAFAEHILSHTQQFIEKILKGLLAELDISPPKIHNIIKLYRLLPEEVKIELDIDSEHLEYLEDIYIETRYPPEIASLKSGVVTFEYAVKVFNTSENTYNTILDYIKTINTID